MAPSRQNQSAPDPGPPPAQNQKAPYQAIKNKTPDLRLGKAPYQAIKNKTPDLRLGKAPHQAIKNRTPDLRLDAVPPPTHRDQHVITTGMRVV